MSDLPNQGDDQVTMGQQLDTGNTVTRTSANGATTFTGSWSSTRDVGFVRQIVVLASNVSSGLGGTFTFEYSEDAAAATISESRSITDFATVRDFDLLNAGAYFRVKFTPSRALVGAEFVAINTTQRHAYDGPFVRLANQEIEESNAAMGQAFAYLKAFDAATGKSVNLRPVQAAGTVVGTDKGLLVKAIITGQQPDGDFENERVSGSDPGNTTNTPLGANAVYTGAAFDATGFLGVSVIVKADVASATDGLRIQFSNNGFTSINREQTFTYGSADAGSGRLYAVAANQGEKFRVKYTNGAVAQTSFDIRTELTVGPIQSQVAPIETPILAASSAQMGRNIMAGKDVATGVYENVSVVKAGNPPTASIPVVAGARPSQLPGRTAVHIVIDSATIDTLLRTTTSGKTFYLTDMHLAMSNTSLLAGGRAVLRDGTTELGTLRIPFITEPATNQGNAGTTHDKTFVEPIPFATGVFMDITSGTVTIAGTLDGYEETN